MRIGVSSNVVAAAASLIGCSILTAPFNYLGVKVDSNMSRINSWDDVISKVSSRLSKWKLKLLSIGGRLTLLKSVLTSIPLYHMSIFKVAIGVLNHLESIRQNFFYGVDGSDRKLAWIGWNMVLTSKKNGGLGVSNTHKLIPRRSPWQDVILAIHSLQSKGINLMDFIQKKVGNGENTSFWDDSWLGEVALKVLYKRLYALEMCKSISVAEKMGHPSLSHSFRRMPRGGVEQENYGLLCSKVADLVLPNISDRWCWSLEGSQEFSVKSSRILIDNTILPKAEVPTRWLRVVPIKVNVHAWRVCLDKLPTRANLSLRGMDIPSIACPLCNSAVESTSHIFFACPLARQQLKVVIEATTFKPTFENEVALTAHMCKVVVLSPDHIKSLLPPSRVRNADDTADKSSSETSMQPITQFKAPTIRKPRKKKIPFSTQLEALQSIRVSSSTT
ncbi:RNA-directed DNA polymerase, eukaryota, reverse transcriptase zinc-binding domain protein [Tanacetum coccineum]